MDLFASSSVPELSRNLLDSYQRVGGINHLDGVNLPSRAAVASITEDLMKLLFPGFFDDQMWHSSKVEEDTVRLMASIIPRLQAEIQKSLYYQPPEGLPENEIEQQSRAWTIEFLHKLPQIREVLKTDVEAVFDGDPAAVSREEVIVAYPFIEVISAQRLAHELYNKKIALIPRIMTEWAHSRTGVDLHPGASIGPYFFIDHGTGAVVGETCIIGERVKIYHGVTLGARSTSGGQQLRGVKRHPTIEDCVTVYPGATILGGETIIGARSTIGGNVFLLESVPPDSLVVSEDVQVSVKTKPKRADSRKCTI